MLATLLSAVLKARAERADGLVSRGEVAVKASSWLCVTKDTLAVVARRSDWTAVTVRVCVPSGMEVVLSGYESDWPSGRVPSETEGSRFPSRKKVTAATPLPFTATCALMAPV